MPCRIPPGAGCEKELPLHEPRGPGQNPRRVAGMAEESPRMTRYVRPSLIGLGFAWAYWPTLEFLFGKWRDDPQYSHGFLVPVFSAWLLWRNRDAVKNAFGN